MSRKQRMEIKRLNEHIARLDLVIENYRRLETQQYGTRGMATPRPMQQAIIHRVEVGVVDPAKTIPAFMRYPVADAKSADRTTPALSVEEAKIRSQLDALVYQAKQSDPSAERYMAAKEWQANRWAKRSLWSWLGWKL